MSDMEHLHQGVAIATQAANEAHSQAGNARELAERIAQTGISTGFGHDPTQVMQASQRLQHALAGLSSAITALDETLTYIIQARST